MDAPLAVVLLSLPFKRWAVLLSLSWDPAHVE
jgi:hypothetical protein